MEMSQAEMEEFIVTKRRAEGTPCTKDNFLQWLQRFDDEMANANANTATVVASMTTSVTAPLTVTTNTTTLSTKGNEKAGRLTGYQYFSDKSNNNYEALEAAAERAEMEYNTNASKIDDGTTSNNNIDEELFDDDIDVDDLSFDDDDVNI
jgi:hypothetical protein